MITPEQRAKIQNILDSGTRTRAVLNAYRDRIMADLDINDPCRAELALAFDNAVPSDDHLIFMGFCPGADFSRRQDTRWRTLGICEFEFDRSEAQVRRFSMIRVGDRIVLKKREIIGKTMKLYGHGKVVGIEHSEEGRRVLKMEWHPEQAVIEVPLMGCNPTVNLKKTVTVIKAMPSEFHRWLGC